MQTIPSPNIFKPLRNLLLLVSFLAGGCSSETQDEARMLVFLERIPPTAENVVYELWFTNGEEYESLRRFRTETGTVSLSIPVTEELMNAAMLIVTVEPRYFFFDTASSSVLLAGDLIDGTAELEVTHPMALNNDFSSASGTFRLATPTSLETEDFDLGLWWFDLDGDMPIQSLFLPPLPQGWLYEGWVVGGEKPLSLGKFSDPARFDTDLAGSAADEETAPLFPGQDFIEPPELLSGFSAMVTVEPQPDYAIAPFAIEILFDQVIERLSVNQPMDNRTARGLPSGLAIISTGLPDR